jgi:iron complex transport system substrate-binding protein
MLLAACGGDSDADAPGSAEPDAAETRVVESTFTDQQVEIPAEPQRVLALWRTGSELADLGVMPVGALDAEFNEEELGAELYAEYQDVPVVGSYEGVDIEQVIELAPDLIIGMDHGGLSIDYTELEEVAPTVILEIAEPTDVWDNYPTVAEVVGLSTDFDEKSAELDAELAAVADEFGDKLEGVEVTSLNYADVLYADTSKSLTWRRIDAAGFDYNPTYTDDPERYATELSLENLPDLADQDIIFYEALPDGTPTPGFEQVLESASFKRLPAAQAGNVFPLATGTNYTFAGAHEQLADLRAAAEQYTPAD